MESQIFEHINNAITKEEEFITLNLGNKFYVNTISNVTVQSKSRT